MSTIMLAQVDGGSFWLPKAASTAAESSDSLFYIILALSAVVLATLVAVLVSFSLKYRRQGGQRRAADIRGNRRLQIASGAVPAALLLLLFVWGFDGFIAETVPVPDAVEIRVTGGDYSWSFRYPGGFASNQLVLPSGRPVRLTMTSTDVIHSFYVPQLRVKRDLVPGRYTTAWVQPTELSFRMQLGPCETDYECIGGAQCYMGACVESNYVLSCAEYCGTRHSAMRANVHVVTPMDWQDWLLSEGGAGGNDPVARGGRYFRSMGCFACHRIAPNVAMPNSAPNLFGLFGREERFSDGTTLVLDETVFDEYVRESLVEPNARLVEGFQPIMTPFGAMLDDAKIADLAAFIRSLEELEE